MSNLCLLKNNLKHKAVFFWRKISDLPNMHLICKKNLRTSITFEKLIKILFNSIPEYFNTQKLILPNLTFERFDSCMIGPSPASLQFIIVRFKQTEE